MKSVKTARGRTIDMAAMVAQKETTRAVSNLNMNARGDIIDSRGNVEIPKEKVSKEYYKNNVPNADTKEISIKDPVEEDKNVDVSAGTQDISRSSYRVRTVR